MKVKEIMRDDVITITENSTAKQAVELMHKHEIGCLLVTRGTEIVGIVTERDILKKSLAENKLLGDLQLKDIMSKNVVAVDPETSIEDAADAMNKNKIKKLVVLSNDKVVGIVTATDLIAAEDKLLKRLTELFPIDKKQGSVGF